MNEFDTKLNEVLKNPAGAVELLKYQPKQRSTDSLLRELEALHKSKVLNDDEFEERKSELDFQRNGNAQAEGSIPGGDADERKRILLSHLETLMAEKVLTPSEYEAIKARI